MKIHQNHSPVNEGSLGIHEIKLMVKTCPSLGDRGGVGKHTHCPGNLSQVASGYYSGRLVVDAHL